MTPKSLPFNNDRNFTREFYVCDANRSAWNALQAAHELPHRSLLITGPEGSGKTHLLHAAAPESYVYIVDHEDKEQQGARIVDTPFTMAATMAIDNIDCLLGSQSSYANRVQQWLCECIDARQKEGCTTLIAARSLPDPTQSLRGISFELLSRLLLIRREAVAQLDADQLLQATHHLLEQRGFSVKQIERMQKSLRVHARRDPAILPKLDELTRNKIAGHFGDAELDQLRY